jgi:hypothetical protein
MTSATLEHRHGVAVLVCSPDGPKLTTEGDATDLIGDAFGQQADLVVVPVERLTDEFFTLRSGLAGAVVQKFVNYRIRLAVVGDISVYVQQSAALRDFVYETNRGNQLWFVTTMDELDARLAAQS